jgi:hypothetical protein
MNQSKPRKLWRDGEDGGPLASGPVAAVIVNPVDRLSVWARQ